MRFDLARTYRSCRSALLALLFGITWVACAHLPALAQQSQPASAPASIPEPTIRISVRRVVVDVVVTDSSGVPVKGLKQSDFRVTEDGKPQQLRSFTSYQPETDTQPVPPPPHLPPNTFTNLSRSPLHGPPTVILYDLLNTPLDSQSYARAQLLKFLKQRSVSGQVAIFVLTDKLHMLQGFTDDEDQLIAALNSQQAKPSKSLKLQGSDEVNQTSNDLIRTEGNQNGSDASQDVSYQTIVGMLQHMETVEQNELRDRRVDITTEALEEIARFLVGLPGRKNLLWLSGSFPSGVLPVEDAVGDGAFVTTRNYSSDVKQATDLLNLSHVAVYPVDVRGLQVNPMFNAGSNQAFEPGTGKDLKAVRNFSEQNDAEHTTMDVIGDETGGRAFYNTNGLTQAVAQAVQDGSTYYSLSYAPTNHVYDGKERHIQVTLLQPGYHLEYRKTYFAEPPDAELQTEANDPLTGALQFGAPVAHELFFEAHLEKVGAPAPATAEQRAMLDKYEAITALSTKRRKALAASTAPVMMQRYFLTYGLLTRQLNLPADADGTRHSNLECAVLSYDADGHKLNGIRTVIRDAIKPEQYEQLLNKAYEIVQVFYVPVNAASLRLAIRDGNTNRMGSLEVHLPLVPEPPADAGNPK
jgi:VWFA-related protein